MSTIITEVDYEVVIPELRAINGESIHVASVIGGLQYTFSLLVLLKSLLFHRSKPLMLHLIVDNDSKPVVAEMLDSWQIPALKYQFYAVEDYANLTSWIPNVHYSANFGHIKLLIPTILKQLDKVIVLDNDLLFLDDIVLMWDFLQNMETLFGMVPEQVPLHMLEPNHWPALVIILFFLVPFF